MKKKIFKGLLAGLIVCFLGLFYAYSNGYYEKKQNDKVLLTNEMIEKFEQDIKDGRDVTIDSYLKEEPDYSTKTTKLSLKLSNKAENLIDGAIKFIFQKLGSVVE